jgi:hypothetical protein
MKIRCDSCGYECEADGKVVDGLDQHRVGGQHVCDRFEAGIFRAVRAVRSIPSAPAGPGEAT